MAEQVTGQRVELVWNKGIAALCDRRFPDEFPDGRSYSPVPAYAGALWSSGLPDNLIADPSAGAKIGDGDLVWVRLSWWKSFVRQVLPLVKANFVLVTGDSDSCVPSELGSQARAVLGCSKIIHWYTQNYDGSVPSERISPIPIGIDFHMVSEKAIWGEDVLSPLEQERALVAIGKSLPPLQARHRRVYADFGWKRGFGLYRLFHPLEGTGFRENRRQLAKKLHRNESVYFQPGPLPRSEMWQKRGEYAFVLSPHGNGLDCHRTWEALALGHIVLVPSSSLDGLYADLPVVPLKSWSEITPENLENWLSRYGNGCASHEKLRSSYWVNEMRSSADPAPGLPLCEPRVQTMEHLTGQRVELVWNKGIAALCDRRFPDEFPDGRSYSLVPAYAGALWSSRLPDNLIADPSARAKIGDGDLVWVRLSWLKSFVRQVLPHVRADFVLVTGDSPSCVPSELGSEAHAVLECSKVVHWYTQDYDGSMPSERISPIPVGIDFHELSEKAIWGEDASSPVEQEQTLVSIAKSLPPLQARLQRVYVDFGWKQGLGLYRLFHPFAGTKFRENRRRLVEKLRRNELVYFQSGPLARREMWRRRGAYAFVLSPHGMGLDCHRTWEALALGHIVLVPSSSLDGLYADLPVVPLKSWSEITPKNLENWLSTYRSGGADHEKLRSSYWVNEMRSRADGGVPLGSSAASKSIARKRT